MVQTRASFGTRTAVVILLLLQCGRLSFVHCDQTGLRPPTKLEDILPEDYDSYQTPKDGGKPAGVSIQIEILNIRSVNVNQMSFIADIFLYKKWKDWRLRYPANKSVEKIALNPQWREKLWTPDVYFHNAIEGRVQNTIIPYVYLFLKNDSTVQFGARLSLQLSCDMALHDFPHDTQYCDIILKSLTHSLSDMDMHWTEKDALLVGDYIVLPQFEYSTPFTADCTEAHHVSEHRNYACLRGVIKMARRSGYYAINIYIPTILIVFMSMLTFWIPPDAVPGRVTLGVTSLLTIITKQYQASLPNVSYVVALNVWLSCCIGFVFCSLLEYAFVIALLIHQKRKQTAEIVPTSESIHTATSTAPQTCWTRIRDTVMNHIENTNCHNVDRVSRGVFPIIFAFQCVIYWAYYAK